MKPAVVLALLTLAAAPATGQAQQGFEITPFAGYTTAGGIDDESPEIQDLELEGGFAWGGAATWFFSERMGAEVLYARQDSALGLATSAGSAELFDVDISQLLGSFVYRFGDAGAAARPFAFAGLGATFFDADDLEGETKLAATLGAGVEWFPKRSLGIRLHARYAPTHLNDASSDYCDPFGFCQGWLHQFEVAGGVVFRFGEP